MSIQGEKAKRSIILLSLSFLGFSMAYLLSIGEFSKLDEVTFRAVNNLAVASLWFDVILLFLGGIGGGYLTPLLVATFALFLRTKRSRESTLLLAISWLLSLAATSFLKPLFANPRPYHILGDVRTHILHYFLGARSLPQTYAFPSSHTTEAFSTSVVLGLRYRRWFTPLIVLALTVAFSMVYFGFHFPSDTLAGGFMGTAIGYSTIQLWNLRHEIADRVSRKERV